MRKRIGVFLAGLLIFCMTSVYAVDVVGFRNDLSFSGNTTENIGGPIKVVWVEKVGSTRSQPVVVGDKLFLGTTWAMVCYNAKWGTKIWQYISKDFSNATPYYYNNSLYAGHTNYLYCIDPKTGYQKWKFNTGTDSINTSPVIYENQVIFGSNNKVIALSADKGAKLWEITFAENVEHPVAITDNMMFAVAKDRIYAFGAKLHNKLWEYQFSNRLIHSFSVSKKQIFACIGDSLISLDKDTGEVLWKQFFPNLAAMSGTSFYGTDVFVSFDQYFYCINAETGKIKWQFEAGFFIESSPSISEKYIWLGADDFIIYCLDRVSGKKLYYGLTGSTSYYTVVANNAIFSLSIYGELYCYIPDIKKKQATATYDLWIGKTYCRLNGKIGPIDAAPFISQGRTMVPLRHIAEALDADIKWFPDEKRITYALNTRFISLIVGSLDAGVNGKIVKLEIAPVLVSGRAFVPLRFVSENLGAKVSWNPVEKKITIFYQY